ncbi:MAG: ATP-binding protein [Betaproteobacteria bacterium]
MATLILVATLVGAFFFREGKKALDAEIRGRAMYVARELAALTADDITTGNRFGLYKKLSPSFDANEESPSDRALLYLMIYNHNCDLLIGSTPTGVFLNNDSYFYTLPRGENTLRDDLVLDCGSRQTHEPFFVIKKRGVYDLTLPVLSGNEPVGFVRVGISQQRYEEKFFGIVKRSAAALLGILLVGLASSQIIALGITKPILQLSDAAEKLSRQNWDTPLPVEGTDEISRLSQTFNLMAHTLKQREASLSRGNRDLFILHTAGLDLMESLDRGALISKVAARAEDLVRAGTTAVSVIDSSDRMLKYLGVYGNKAKAIREQEPPIEAGGIYNWLASYGTPLLISDAQADFRLDGALMKSLGIKSVMTVPLWSSNTMIGLLTAINKKGGARFDKHDLRLFTVFSNLASAALQNASLYSDLKDKMDELKTAQEQLVRSARMAAIGELSANVAHEINNPLTSVLGYTTHLLKTQDMPDSAHKMLGMMEQETLRVRKIIRNLLDFARQRPAWMHPEDISIPLRETVTLIQGIADTSSIAIREECSAGTFFVNMDYNEIKQVFINIVSNALQAMPQGGELRVGLSAAGENDVVAEFSDTGAGIAPEHLHRIFEPFFSTKDNCDGIGLGLSISYRIIQNHGGRIEAESTVGKGTTLRVFLPRFLKIQTAQNAIQAKRG